PLVPGGTDYGYNWISDPVNTGADSEALGGLYEALVVYADEAYETEDDFTVVNVSGTFYDCYDGMVSLAGLNIPLNASGLSLLWLAYTAFILDNPQYYFFRSDVFLTGSDTDSGLYTLIIPVTGADYRTYTARIQANSTIDAKYAEYEALAARVSTPYEKARIVHDKMLAERDYSYYNGAPDMRPPAHNILGVMDLNTPGPVCESYACAYTYILNRLGLEALTVFGMAGNLGSGGGGGHAWNLVKIGGQYYNTDPTWDDWEVTGYPAAAFNDPDNLKNLLTYEFFLLGGSNAIDGLVLNVGMHANVGMAVLNHEDALADATVRFESGTLGWGEGITTDVSAKIDPSTTHRSFHVGNNHVRFAHAPLTGDPVLIHGDANGVLHFVAQDENTLAGWNPLALRGGTLLVDMDGMASPTNAIHPGIWNFNVEGGTLHIKGKDGAASAQTLDRIWMNNYQQGAFVLEAGESGTLDMVINQIGGSVPWFLELSVGENATLKAGARNAFFPRALLKQGGVYSLTYTDDVSGEFIPIPTSSLGDNLAHALVTGSYANEGGMRNWETLTIDAGAAGVLDLGGQLANTGAILHRGAHDYTIRNGATWPNIGGQSPLSIYVTGEGKLIFDEDFEIAYGLGGGYNGRKMTKAGAGRLVLKNSFYGDEIWLYQGSVEIWANDALGRAADLTYPVTIAGDVTIAAGVDALDVPHNITLGNWYTFPQGRNLTVEVNRGDTLTLSGAIGGKGDLIKTGDGTLILAANDNAFLGGVTLKGGTLSVGSLSQLGYLAYEIMKFRGGSLQVTGTDIATLDAKYIDWENFDGGLDVADALNALTVSTPVNVATGGMFRKGGAGALMLAGGLDLHGGTFAAD
ncbi:MAG: autotransporter-associated beta strand repeat-containing protein, partial [Kiritimatiellaeota bacterium]|nr:autotransporter-associated beta strand repeat-containing protein [Kiritimatiellota bacterium]